MRDERTLRELVQDAIGNVQEIVRSEFQLVRVEIRDRIVRTRRPAIMIAVGSMVCLYAVIFLLLSIVYKLSMIVEPWLAALIVGAVLGLFGIVILVSAASKLKEIDAIPRRSIETLKENMTWSNKQIE